MQAAPAIYGAVIDSPKIRAANTTTDRGSRHPQTATVCTGSFPMEEIKYKEDGMQVERSTVEHYKK